MLEKSPQETTRWEEDQQFTWLLENMTDAFMTVSARWECTAVNHQAEEALGETQQAVVGRTLWEIFSSDSDTTFYQKAHQAMDQRIVLPFTLSYSPLNRWFTGRLIPFQTGIALFFQDTTSQMRAEQAFHQNEMRIHRFIESNIIGVIISDNESILEANEAFLEIVGYTKEDIDAQALNWSRITPPEYASLDQMRQQSLLAHGTCMPYEKEYYRKDGTRVPVLIGATLLQEKPFQWACFVIDMTKQKRVEEELQRSEKRLNIWIENVADIITILDKEGTILYQSPALERVLGWKPEERIKQNVLSSTFVHPEDKQKKHAFFTDVLYSLNTTITSTFRMMHKNGSYRFIEARGRNFLTSPDIQSIIATYRDVTEREELEQRKDEFISMASHELKTPLTSLKGYAQVLKMELESLGMQQTVEDLALMDHQIDTLIRLISDFLDVSRMRAGMLVYHQETFELDSFIQQMIEILQRVSPHHHILLTGASHTLIAGDRERLGQILVNLVTNAVKYAPETDSIEVHIAATTDTVTISVHDDGIGIPQKHQQKIFERFYRVPNTPGQAVSGLGMGLYICREIVQRHNGKIWVESDEGQGSRFFFSLPILKQEQPRKLTNL